jgi:hypothetical protein
MGKIMMNETEVTEAPVKENKEYRTPFSTGDIHKSSLLSDILTNETPRNMSIRKAQVQRIKGKDVMISISGNAKTQIAKTAFSCMVEPRIGDIVLCAADEIGAYYILSIVERPGSCQTTTLSFPDDVVVKTPESVSMVAEKSIHLIAEEQLNCMAKKTLHQSDQTTICTNEIIAKGKQFSGYFEKLNIISGIVQSFSERFIRKSKSYIRKVEDDDQVSAKQLTRHAEGLCTIKSDVTMMKSEKDTFIDGEHVFTSL